MSLVSMSPNDLYHSVVKRDVFIQNGYTHSDVNVWKPEYLYSLI